MKPYKLWSCYSQQRNLRIITLITVFNFAAGIFMLALLMANFERKEQAKVRIDHPRIAIDGLSPIKKQTSYKKYYHSYVRIDYTSFHFPCRSPHMFNATDNIEAIRAITNSKLNTILRNITVDIDIIVIDPVIKKVNAAQQQFSDKHSKALCDYFIKLYIGVNFPRKCDKICQSHERRRLSMLPRPFGDPLNFPLSLQLRPPNTQAFTISLKIDRVRLAQSTAYFQKEVFIRSFDDTRYLFALILDAAARQTSITMSPKDKSTFLITGPLHEYASEHDSSTVYISIMSLAAHNTYLRHENRRIKLGKNDDSTLFKQDATFKLLISETNDHLVAFQSINIPDSFIGIDRETRTALLLMRPEQKGVTIDYLDPNYLFKLHNDE